MWTADSRNGRSLQSRLHEAIISVGGYWRPLAAVARTLEELGELAVAIENEDPNAISAEVADLWIITTCLATQYCIDVPDPKPVSIPTSPKPSRLPASLIAAAGEIARTVNYYDGPKPPRRLDCWQPLRSHLDRFHSELSIMAGRFGVDTYAEVQSKVQNMETVDKGRFAVQFDPSIAPALTMFGTVGNTTACPYARKAKLWGAPNWEDGTPVQNAGNIAQFLSAFAKCAPHESLDGFVIAIDQKLESLTELGRLLNHLLRALADGDTVANDCFHRPVDVPKWQFTFGGIALFVSVFSPLYPAGHPRHSPEASFIMLQPTTSFDDHGIGSSFANSDRLKGAVRWSFLDGGGTWYPTSLIGHRMEARIYLPPRYDADIQVPWWLLLD